MHRPFAVPAPISVAVTPAATSPTRRLVVALAPVTFAALVAYPVLLAPLIEPAPPPQILIDIGPPAVDAESGLFNKLYFPALAVLAALSAAAAHGRELFARLRDPAVVLLGLFCLWIGVTSPFAVEPEIALRRAVLETMIVAGVVGATLAARDPRRLVDAVVLVLAVTLALNVWAVMTRPPTALGHSGLYTHKNVLGVVAATSGVAAVLWLGSASVLRRIAAVAIIAVALGLIVLAKAKTALGLLALAPMLAVALAVAARLVRVSPALALPLIAGLVWFGYALGEGFLLWDAHAALSAVFGDPTLTQRTDIWAFVVRMIPERPILGFGYEVFWGAGPASPSVTQGPGFVAKMPQAHNGYLDLILQTGLVGFLITMALLFVSLHRVGRLTRHDLGLATGLLALVLLIALYNGFESSFFRSYNIGTIVFVFVATVLGRPDLQQERQPWRA